MEFVQVFRHRMRIHFHVWETLGVPLEVNLLASLPVKHWLNPQPIIILN